MAGPLLQGLQFDFERGLLVRGQDIGGVGDEPRELGEGLGESGGSEEGKQGDEKRC
jgi:hypothetical protein